MIMENKGGSEEWLFQTHIADFNSVREEITLHINLQNQIINYSIAIAAGVLTLASIGKPNLIETTPDILLVLSLLMAALSWSSLEHSVAIANLSSYINNILAPKIQTIIDEGGLNEFSVLRWEDKAWQSGWRRRVWNIAGLGKHAISFIINVIILIMFFVFRDPFKNNLSVIEIILLTSAFLSVVLVPIVGFIVNQHALDK